MPYSDERALRRWMDHRDAEAFRSIVLRYSGMVYATCRRILGDATEAEDVAQECFEALAQAPKVPGAFLGPWLHRVATNLSLRHMRVHTRRRKREERFMATRTGSGNPEQDDTYRYVDEAIARLPEKLRILLVAHFLDGRTHADIAKSLGVSRQTVTERTRLAIEKVRAILKRRGIAVTSVTLTALFSSSVAEAAPSGLIATLGKLALTEVPRTSTVPIAQAVGGIFAVKKILIVTMALAVLGIGITLVTRPTPQDLPSPRPVVRAIPAPPVEIGDALESIERLDQLEASDPASDEEISVAFDESTDPVEASGIWAIHGSVLDENGSLVSGARVELRLLKWYEHRTGYNHLRTIPDRGIRWSRVSDERGAFQFDRLPLGNYLVTAYTGSALGTTDALVRNRWTERVFVRLRHGGSIAGVVRTMGGEILSNARVAVFEHIPNAGETAADPKQTPLLSTSSGADGAFRLDHLWSGAWRLRVDSAGHPVSVTEAVPVGTLDAQVTIGVGARVEGMVILALTDEPVANAVITFKPKIGPLEYSSTSDESGVFSLVDLPAGEHAVSVEHHEWRLSDGPEKLVVLGGEKISGLRFVLTEGGSVSGRIYDEQTNEGIAGVLVRAEPQSVASWGTAGRMSVPTDTSGHYRIAGLEADTYRVSFEEVAGYPYDRFERGFAHQVVTVAESASVSDIDFGVSRGARVAGIVVDELGRPVSGVIVEGRYRFYRGGVSPDEYAVSNEDGGFEMFGFPVLTPQGQATASEFEGLYIRARQRDGGRLSEALGPFLLPPQGIEGLQLHLSEAGAVSGRVVDENGHAMAAAQVTAYPEHSFNFGFPSAISDVNGAFELGEVMPGGYSLRVKPAGMRDTSPDLAWVDVDQGNSVTNVRLVYDAGFSIQGMVTDAEGLPILGAQVAVHSLEFSGPGSHAPTQRDGTFRIGGLAPGSYRMTIQHDAYARGQISSVPAGSADLHISLDTAAAVWGFVSEGGDPLEGIRIVVRTEEADRFLAETRTGEDGAFEIGSLSAGSMIVRAYFNFADSPPEHVEEQRALLEPGAVTEVYFSF